MDENNGLKTTYSALSFQFLLEEIMTWAAQETAREITGTTDISRLTATPKAILIREFQESTLITYQTAIALNLSHQWNTPVNDVAAHIARHMGRIVHEQSAVRLPTLVHSDEENTRDISRGCPSQANADGVAEQWPLPRFAMAIGRTLTLDIHPKGYVQCHLAATTLDMWLQAMVQVNRGHTRPNVFFNRIHHDANLPPSSSGTTSKHQNPLPAPSQDPQRVISDIPFAVFQAHARCCSILRLAHTTDQIRLQSWLDGEQNAGIGQQSSQPSVLRPPWTIIEPQPLPWQMILSPLKYPQQWAIAHPLLVQIITSLDQFVALTAKASYRSQNHSQKYSQKTYRAKLLKEITALSTAIHRFDAAIPIYGKTSNMAQEKAHPTVVHPASSLPYLGLILIAQGLLNNLLTHFLEQSNICLDIPDEL